MDPLRRRLPLEITVRNSIISGSFSDGVATELEGVLTSQYSIWNGVDEEGDGDTDGVAADGEDAGGEDADGTADTDAGEELDTGAGSDDMDDGDQTAGGPSDGSDSEETGTVGGETLPATGAAVSPALVMVGFGAVLMGAVLLSIRSTRLSQR